MEELINGPYTETVTDTRIYPLSTYSSSNPTIFNSLKSVIEETSHSLHGVKCGYADNLYPYLVSHPAGGEYLILYYPDAVLNAALKITAVPDLDVPFSSTVPGLSLNGISFNIDNFVSSGGGGGPFSYTYSTLSEYYLQTPISEGLYYDIRYYNYRFMEPARWGYSMGGTYSSLTNDPVHIGGSNSTKNGNSSISYKSLNYNQSNPVVQY